MSGHATWPQPSPRSGHAPWPQPGTESSRVPWAQPGPRNRDSPWPGPGPSFDNWARWSGPGTRRSPRAWHLPQRQGLTLGAAPGPGPGHIARSSPHRCVRSVGRSVARHQSHSRPALAIILPASKELGEGGFAWRTGADEHAQTFVDTRALAQTLIRTHASTRLAWSRACAASARQCEQRRKPFKKQRNEIARACLNRSASLAG